MSCQVRYGTGRKVEYSIFSQENKNDDLGFAFLINSLTLVVLMDF